MQTIEELKKQYKPIVQALIDSNIKFYGFNNKIEWEFFANENTAIFGFSKQDLKRLKGFFYYRLSIKVNWDFLSKVDIDKEGKMWYFLLQERKIWTQN